jgi:hypothetical protein
LLWIRQADFPRFSEGRTDIVPFVIRRLRCCGNPDNPNSPTFGDLIKAGKLPGGELKTGIQKTGN